MYYARFINLAHRTDRLARMRDELRNVKSFEADRTEAYYPHEVNEPMSKIGTMYRRTPGAVGCHFSQVRVMKEARAFGLHAIVMEDDLHFCEDFDERFQYIDGWLQNNDWDVFWLGSSFHVNPPYWHRHGGSGMPPDVSANLGYDAKLTADPRIIRTYGAFCTFAYIVNVNSIDKILNLFDQYIHESIGIDHLFIRLQPQLKCFSFLPGLVRQYDNQSDIGTGETIWSGFLKLNGSYENSSYVFQERKEMFDPLTFNWNEAHI